MFSSCLHGPTQAANSWSHTEKFNTFWASEQNENSFGQYISLQFLDISYTMMAGEEESLQLRIDVYLDQNKESEVDVVTLESDCPPLSSSSSSDGTMSGP